jgi:hypothetical protein
MTRVQRLISVEKSLGVDRSAQPPLMESSGVLVALRAESQALKVRHR